jgi:hypothetical protein
MITELTFNSPFFLLFGLHCLIGAVGAIIAQNKGYSLGKWLLFGLVGGTFALIAILLKPEKE